MPTYTTSQAARIAGIAASSIRNYTRDPRLTPHFSPTAATTPRQLTTDDVKTLRYIADATAAGSTISDVADRLTAGDVDLSQWAPPDAPQQTTDAPLIDPAMMLALQTLREQFSAAHDQNSELQRRLIDAETRAAILQTQLDAITQRRRSWLQRLFDR